jgi:hypothetical protein
VAKLLDKFDWDKEQLFSPPQTKNQGINLCLSLGGCVVSNLSLVLWKKGVNKNQMRKMQLLMNKRK